MWKWHRPSNPKLVFEHHSEENARSCMPSDAVLVDDGVPCSVPNCKFPYVRKLSDYGRISS